MNDFNRQDDNFDNNNDNNISSTIMTQYKNNDVFKDDCNYQTNILDDIYNQSINEPISLGVNQSSTNYLHPTKSNTPKFGRSKKKLDPIQTSSYNNNTSGIFNDNELYEDSKYSESNLINPKKDIINSSIDASPSAKKKNLVKHPLFSKKCPLFSKFGFESINMSNHINGNTGCDNNNNNSNSLTIQNSLIDTSELPIITSINKNSYLRPRIDSINLPHLDGLSIITPQSHNSLSLDSSGIQSKNRIELAKSPILGINNNMLDFCVDQIHPTTTNTVSSTIQYEKIMNHHHQSKTRKNKLPKRAPENSKISLEKYENQNISTQPNSHVQSFSDKPISVNLNNKDGSIDILSTRDKSTSSNTFQNSPSSKKSHYITANADKKAELLLPKDIHFGEFSNKQAKQSIKDLDNAQCKDENPKSQLQMDGLCSPSNGNFSDMKIGTKDKTTTIISDNFTFYSGNYTESLIQEQLGTSTLQNMQESDNKSPCLIPDKLANMEDKLYEKKSELKDPNVKHCLTLDSSRKSSKIKIKDFSPLHINQNSPIKNGNKRNLEQTQRFLLEEFLNLDSNENSKIKISSRSTRQRVKKANNDVMEGIPHHDDNSNGSHIANETLKIEAKTIVDSSNIISGCCNTNQSMVNDYVKNMNCIERMDLNMDKQLINSKNMEVSLKRLNMNSAKEAKVCGKTMAFASDLKNKDNSMDNGHNKLIATITQDAYSSKEMIQEPGINNLKSRKNISNMMNSKTRFLRTSSTNIKSKPKDYPINLSLNQFDKSQNLITPKSKKVHISLVNNSLSSFLTKKASSNPNNKLKLPLSHLTIDTTTTTPSNGNISSRNHLGKIQISSRESTKESSSNRQKKITFKTQNDEIYLKPDKKSNFYSFDHGELEKKNPDSATAITKQTNLHNKIPKLNTNILSQINESKANKTQTIHNSRNRVDKITREHVKNEDSFTRDKIHNNSLETEGLNCSSRGRSKDGGDGNNSMKLSLDANNRNYNHKYEKNENLEELRTKRIRRMKGLVDLPNASLFDKDNSIFDEKFNPDSVKNHSNFDWDLNLHKTDQERRKISQPFTNNINNYQHDHDALIINKELNIHNLKNEKENEIHTRLDARINKINQQYKTPQTLLILSPSHQTRPTIINQIQSIQPISIVAKNQQNQGNSINKHANDCNIEQDSLQTLLLSNRDELIQIPKDPHNSNSAKIKKCGKPIKVLTDAIYSKNYEKSNQLTRDFHILTDISTPNRNRQNTSFRKERYKLQDENKIESKFGYYENIQPTSCPMSSQNGQNHFRLFSINTSSKLNVNSPNDLSDIKTNNNNNTTIDIDNQSGFNSTSNHEVITTTTTTTNNITSTTITNTLNTTATNNNIASSNLYDIKHELLKLKKENKLLKKKDQENQKKMADFKLRSEREKQEWVNKMQSMTKKWMSLITRQRDLYEETLTKDKENLKSCFCNGVNHRLQEPTRLSAESISMIPKITNSLRQEEEQLLSETQQFLDELSSSNGTKRL